MSAVDRNCFDDAHTKNHDDDFLMQLNDFIQNPNFFHSFGEEDRLTPVVNDLLEQDPKTAVINKRNFSVDLHLEFENSVGANFSRQNIKGNMSSTTYEDGLSNLKWIPLVRQDILGQQVPVTVAFNGSSPSYYDCLGSDWQLQTEVNVNSTVENKSSQTYEDGYSMVGLQLPAVNGVFKEQKPDVSEEKSSSHTHENDFGRHEWQPPEFSGICVQQDPKTSDFFHSTSLTKPFTIFENLANATDSITKHEKYFVKDKCDRVFGNNDTSDSSDSWSKNTMWNPKRKRVYLKCINPNCSKLARPLSTVCVEHGATQQKCLVPRCNNLVVNNRVCVKHGAKRKKNKKCNFYACMKEAKAGGTCYQHGAKRKTCGDSECKNVAIKKGFCEKHWAQKLS